MARKRRERQKITRSKVASDARSKSRIRTSIVSRSGRKRWNSLPKPLPYFKDLTPTQRDLRGRVFQAVSLRRRSLEGKLTEPVSLSDALRQAGTTRNSLLKFPGLFTRKSDGSIEVTRGDRYTRQVQILIPLRYGDGDTRTTYVRSSREASLAGRYMNTVAKVLRGKGDFPLHEFRNVTVGGYPLLTDAAAIRRMADAGLIRVDQFGSGQELRGEQ